MEGTAVAPVHSATKCEEHGKQKDRCLECYDLGRDYTTSICEHRKFKHICKLCGGSGRCAEHQKVKARCIECFDLGRPYVTQICIHRREKPNCRECGGRNRCEAHGKLKKECVLCYDLGEKWAVNICEHRRVKSYCKQCGGSALCVEHRKSKRHCVDCYDQGKPYVTQVCIHRKLKRYCSDCGSEKFCQHRKVKVNCVKCRPQPDSGLALPQMGFMLPTDCVPVQPLEPIHHLPIPVPKSDPLSTLSIRPQQPRTDSGVEGDPIDGGIDVIFYNTNLASNNDGVVGSGYNEEFEAMTTCPHRRRIGRCSQCKLATAVEALSAKTPLKTQQPKKRRSRSSVEMGDLSSLSGLGKRFRTDMSLPPPPMQLVMGTASSARPSPELNICTHGAGFEICLLCKGIDPDLFLV